MHSQAVFRGGGAVGFFCFCFFTHNETNLQVIASSVLLVQCLVMTVLCVWSDKNAGKHEPECCHGENRDVTLYRVIP